MKFRQLKPYSLLTGFVVGLLLTMWVTYVPYPHIVRVMDWEYPNENVPVIVAAGENFRIYVETESAKLDNQTVQVENGFVHVPSNLELGWHDLTLFTDGKEEVRRNAVYIPPHTSMDFTFVFMTDVHTPPVGGPFIEYEQLIDNINSIGPAFVISGGDQTDFGLDEEYDSYEQFMSKLEMPVYNYPGNHETYSDPNLERYARRLGPGNYFFYFGDVFFVVASPLHAYRGSGGFNRDQLRWLGETLSKEAKLKFTLTHIPTAYHIGREYTYVPWFRKKDYFTQIVEGHNEMREIFARENVVSLFGHWHLYTEKFEYKGLTFYHTPSVTRNSRTEEGPRFRIFHIENNEITFDRVIELGKLKVKREFYASDNVKVTICNDLGFAVPMTIHVKLSSEGCPYSASVGEVAASTLGGDVWVRVEASPETTEVKITPRK